MGASNAKDRDMFSDFETWEDQTLWPAIKKQFGGSESAEAAPAVQVAFSTPRRSDLRQDVQESLIVDARSLTKCTDGLGGKRHLTIQLPSGSTYSAGDYLAVLPHNSKEVVGRVMRRFHLAWDAHVTIQSSYPTTLPTNVSLPVSEVLDSYVELNQVATKRVRRNYLPTNYYVLTAFPLTRTSAISANSPTIAKSRRRYCCCQRIASKTRFGPRTCRFLVY